MVEQTGIFVPEGFLDRVRLVVLQDVFPSVDGMNEGMVASNPVNLLDDDTLGQRDGWLATPQGLFHRTAPEYCSIAQHSFETAWRVGYHGSKNTKQNTASVNLHASADSHHHLKCLRGNNVKRSRLCCERLADNHYECDIQFISFFLLEGLKGTLVRE
ncbi:leucine-rich repeat extensin-like protein 3-like [Dorcoceras hygrometricum]|uniref:Leucine-rich repeat extensin-like protein 3-like n=1 Tax=Dorcoceras hygrometricum TaxID=472368 RepID=A0A2Z7A4I2_9LAMI|nr:leucine-rich repeat extensin-like protein 3-like [Dorcoceras hygrometricum]